VDVQTFNASKSQRRVLTKNKDLSVSSVQSIFSTEHYELYCRYQAFKHPGGSMESFGENEYEEFLCQSFGNSLMFETRLGEKL
jgi:arginine-tRNA-protein transferase